MNKTEVKEICEKLINQKISNLNKASDKLRRRLNELEEQLSSLKNLNSTRYLKPGY